MAITKKTTKTSKTTKRVKRTSKKQEEPDFSTLDAAVNELAKQTEALLGTPEKPHAVTVKKSAVSKSKAKTITTATKTAKAGKSFDVIAPKHQRTVKATLKAAPEATEDDHANMVPMVVGHDAGKLQLAGEERGDEAIEEIASAQKEPAESKPVARESLVFAEEAEETSDDKPVEAEPEVKDLDEEGPAPAETDTAPATKEDPPSDSNDDAVKKKPGKSNPKGDKSADDEPPAVETGEVYANNLVKDALPKGYTASVKQQKPTVFDTNEYHPELHDWSKLEHKGGWKWVILGLLLAVAAGLAYVLVTDSFRLPF